MALRREASQRKGQKVAEVLRDLVSDSGSYCPLIWGPGDTKNQSVLGLRFKVQK